MVKVIFDLTEFLGDESHYVPFSNLDALASLWWQFQRTTTRFLILSLLHAMCSVNSAVHAHYVIIFSGQHLIVVMNLLFLHLEFTYLISP